MSSNFAILLTGAVMLLNVLVFAGIIILRLVRADRKRRLDKAQALFLSQLETEQPDFSYFKAKTLLMLYGRLSDSLLLKKAFHEQILGFLSTSKVVKTLTKRLYSPFFVRRIESAVHLKPMLTLPSYRTLFLQALSEEKSQVVVLYLFQALAWVKEKRAILPMIRRLGRATPWMAGRYRTLLIGYEFMLLPYLKKRLSIDRTYLGLLICEYAIAYPSDALKPYLLRRAQEKNIQVRKCALEALRLHFPHALLEPEFLESPFPSTMLYVIRAYARIADKRNIAALLSYSKYSRARDQLVQSLSEMAYKDPSLLKEYLSRFEKTRSKSETEVLAKVLDNRLTYILTAYQGDLDEQLTNLITSLIEQQHISGLVQFLNTNAEIHKQQQLISLVRKLAKRSKHLRLLFFAYLHPAVYKTLKIAKPETGKPSMQVHQEKPQRLTLILLLILTLAVFPLIIFLSELPNLIDLSLGEFLSLYVVRFNYLLVYYSVIINLIYLTMLLISYRGAGVQNRLWRAKDKRMLFTKGLLPSVSIIAPAYNEAANIIESTNSLLNQQYPDFELIVVNDGSKDETLQTLITYFNLEKRDQLVPRRLRTRPMRGIYKNKNIPNLVVVDKVNGGKADSLNLGLNVATKQFFCGIDADSLLEPDALLRAVSVMLDNSTETIASGGNICPVNGCDVELGSLDSIGLPSKFLPRLQSLEYIRSFMTGRVGWARLNVLLIISGAFGIFHRDRTIATGGYLTKSGRFHKDTVGEDMELVVRLSRYMRERKLPYRVQYASNANCWTEVPEKWKVLHRQRDRWHRGLIDILLFHSTMIANPRYGRLGMVGMLYYFLFELLGPFVEAQGLVFVFIGALMGLLNIPIALALFTSTILLGILVSLSALLISEFDRPLYAKKDMLRLVWMAIVENFGVRQVISLWRVSAYFSAMRKNRGWGAQVRTGFKGAQTKTK